MLGMAYDDFSVRIKNLSLVTGVVSGALNLIKVIYITSKSFHSGSNSLRAVGMKTFPLRI